MRQVLAVRAVGGENGFLVQRTQYGRRTRTEPNADEHAFLCLVQQGSYFEETPHGWRQREAGSVHFHAAGEVKRSIVGDDDMVAIAVSIRHERLKDLEKVTSDEEAPDMRNGMLPALIHQIAACLSSNSRGSTLLMEARAIEAYYEFGRLLDRSAPKVPAWFWHAQTLLALDRPVTDVAHECGIHPASFARSFRRWSDCSPAEFARRLRLEKAKHMLEEGRATVGEVAAEAGFSDQSHLAREFRRRYGIPPSKLLRSR